MDLTPYLQTLHLFLTIIMICIVVIDLIFIKSRELGTVSKPELYGRIFFLALFLSTYIVVWVK